MLPCGNRKFRTISRTKWYTSFEKVYEGENPKNFKLVRFLMGQWRNWLRRTTLRMWKPKGLWGFESLLPHITRDASSILVICSNCLLRIVVDCAALVMQNRKVTLVRIRQEAQNMNILSIFLAIFPMRRLFILNYVMSVLWRKI